MLGCLEKYASCSRRLPNRELLPVIRQIEPDGGAGSPVHFPSKGASVAHRFTRLQAAREVVEARVETSTRELANGYLEMRRAAWTCHDECKVHLSADAAE